MTFLGTGLSAVAHASTTSGYVLGHRGEAELVDRLSQRFDVPAVASCAAAAAALRTNGVGRVQLVHPPWFDDADELGATYFRDQGFDAAERDSDSYLTVVRDHVRLAIGYGCDMAVPDLLARAASSAGGQVLRGATRLVAARPAAKPLHPRGSVARGTLRRFGAVDETGAEWLDRVGQDDVLVRQSRAVGMPAPLPDVFGLAVRVPTEGGRHGDLLFASTGLGRLTRYTLTLAGSPHRRPLTTLLPYRTPTGGVLLSAVFHDATTVALAWARGSEEWHAFAELALHRVPDGEEDARLSFDPILNQLPGLETYAWVRRLREPAYSTARESRRS